MTALALALAYLGTLAFAASHTHRRDRYRTDVRDAITDLDHKLGVQALRIDSLETRAPSWNDAAEYVENDRIRRGVTTRRQA